MRELILQGSPLSVTVLAKRTGMSRYGIQNVLEKLINAGVVRLAGIGHGAIYHLSPDHPLLPALHTLFLAEHERYHRVLDGIREAAQSVQPELVAVWLYGSVARGEDRIESDFDLTVVVQRDDDVERVVGQFRDALRPLGDEQQVSFAVIGLSLRDVKRLVRGRDSFWESLSSDARALYGPRPEVLVEKRSISQSA